MDTKMDTRDGQVLHTGVLMNTDDVQKWNIFFPK